MEENISVQVSENEYLNLKDPQEKFRALTWILMNGDQPYISTYILNPSNDEGLNQFIYSKDYHRNKLRSEIKNFFSLFCKSDTDNFLSEYLLDYSNESDLVKKSRLTQLLKGLESSIFFNWEEGGAFIFLSIRDKDNSFVKESGSEEFFWYHYLIWSNLKSIYDLIWDYYSPFVDKEKLSFKYVYSHKEKPQKSLKFNLDSDHTYPAKELSRKQVLEKLLDASDTNLELFTKYEEKLIDSGFLDEDRNKWLEDPSSFIRFYNYCEEKEILKDYHRKTSKGVKYMRQLYNFNVGTSLDTPSKRLKQNTVREKYQFSFLNII